MTLALPRLLPCPGPVWGDYPVRPADDPTPAPRPPSARSARARLDRIVAGAALHGTHWQPRALADLRARLRAEGLTDANLARGLGVAALVAAHATGWRARPNQLLAAAALLDGRLAEMATGEGKTLAIALAAAVGALAGMPVHVVTANAYLAARDAARLAPFYAALGLRVAALREGEPDDDRRAAYANDVVYATAKELAFDFLRDRQQGADSGAAARAARALAGASVPAPLLRGLSLALLDEADSILLDEADVPLILSRAAPHAARRAFLWQALALARGLQDGVHFTRSAGLGDEPDAVVLTAAGEERLAALGPGLGGPWLRPRYRREAVAIALAALHVYRRDEHYVVRAGRVELLDAVTGRVAEGRVWGRGLHTVVALKEGASPAPETETVAQTSFQRFFQRYWRLGGLSGTLREARAEVRAVYGLPVLRVPPHRRSRLRALPPRAFADPAALHDAIAARARALRAAGRPLLVGTDSVADSLAVSAALAAAGVPHEVLNALNDAAEAGIVARAGEAGRVTVATRMAGRGTDIALDDAARAAGGLHVICCQRNPSRRLDRQLAGRAARGGDPGSWEAWLPAPKAAGSETYLAQSATEAEHNTDPERPFTTSSPPHADSDGCPDRAAEPCPATPLTTLVHRLALAGHRLAQSREERRRAAARRQLLRQDLDWERRLAFAGPAP